MLENIKIELAITSDKINFNDVSNFRIGLKITNNNDKIEFFDVSKTNLFVNTIKSISWDLCTHNGTIINLSIPPKKSKTVQWPLGEALFTSTGEYHLKLVSGSFIQITKVTVVE